MKGATMVATLERLGRPRVLQSPSVSNDNAYSESLFRTLKYRPAYPTQPFADLAAARSVGRGVCALVQHAASAQRDSVCHARRSARGARHRAPRRASRRLHARPSPHARALERRHSQLGTHQRRPTQSGARRTKPQNASHDASCDIYLDTHRSTYSLWWIACMRAACGGGRVPLAAQNAPPNRATVGRQVDSLMRRFVAGGGGASVAVAVIRGEDTLVMSATGLADLGGMLGGKHPATATTIYRLGSVTKQFTAALILKLAERRRLSIDDSLGRYLPRLPAAWHSIKIRQLLNHTGGLTNYTEVRGARSTWAKDVTPDQLVRMAGDTVEFPAGCALVVQQRRVCGARHDHRESDGSVVCRGRRPRVVYSSGHVAESVLPVHTASWEWNRAGVQRRPPPGPVHEHDAAVRRGSALLHGWRYGEVATGPPLWTGDVRCVVPCDDNGRASGRWYGAELRIRPRRRRDGGPSPDRARRRGARVSVSRCVLPERFAARRGARKLGDLRVRWSRAVDSARRAGPPTSARYGTAARAVAPNHVC